jgi:hypothetical protein
MVSLWCTTACETVVCKEVDKAFLAGLSMCIPCKYALSGARTALGYRRGTAGAPSSASWGDVGTM